MIGGRKRAPTDMTCCLNGKMVGNSRGIIGYRQEPTKVPLSVPHGGFSNRFGPALYCIPIVFAGDMNFYVDNRKRGKFAFMRSNHANSCPLFASFFFWSSDVNSLVFIGHH